MNGIKVHSVVLQEKDLLPSADVTVDTTEALLHDGLPDAVDALLQVYAVSETGRIMAKASVKGWVSPMRGTRAARAVTDLNKNGPNRVVASTLHRGGDVHNWEFPVGYDDGDHVLCMKVLLEECSGVVQVKWNLDIKGSTGNVCVVTRIDAVGDGVPGTIGDSATVFKSPPNSLFAHVIPKGFNGPLCCEIQADDLNTPVRYVIYRSAHPFPVPVVCLYPSIGI
jgi:hypothetical protein